MLYGTECWAAIGQHEHKVSVAEMRMLQWMSGHTRKNKIRNGSIRERPGVVSIIDKMVESRLRWYGERRSREHPVKRVDQIRDTMITKGRVRQKKTIKRVIKEDLRVNALNPNIIHDRAQ